jgi:hypothetical protein
MKNFPRASFRCTVSCHLRNSKRQSFPTATAQEKSFWPRRSPRRRLPSKGSIPSSIQDMREYHDLIREAA